MKKKILISGINVGESFYSDSTKYVKHRVYHNSCYDRIQGATFALGVEGSNKDCIVVFNNTSYVEIDCPDLTFADISIGQEFKVKTNQYCTYKKVRCESGKYFAITGNLIYTLKDTDVVERVE